MNQLSEFVKKHESAFQSDIRETVDSLNEAESALGFPLPEDLKWLLQEWGYSASCGLSNLQEAVTRSIEWRKIVNLPPDLLALEDWGDGGVILVELSNRNGIVHWIGSEDVTDLAIKREFLNEDHIFGSFGEWVIYCYDHFYKG